MRLMRPLSEIAEAHRLAGVPNPVANRTVNTAMQEFARLAADEGHTARPGSRADGGGRYIHPGQHRR